MPHVCSWNCGVSGAILSVFRQYSHRCNNASVRIKQSNLHYAANACARGFISVVPLPARVCPQPLTTQELIIWSCELTFYMNFLLIEFIIARISNYNIARMIPPSSPASYIEVIPVHCLWATKHNVTHQRDMYEYLNINATAYCCCRYIPIVLHFYTHILL